MKITDIKAIPLVIPLKETPPLSMGTAVMGAPSCQYHVLVKVFTDEGITGYGEAWRIPPGAVSSLIEEALKPLLIGENPMHVERLWHLMYRTTWRYGGKGLTLHCISGVEIALWDIIGKYRNLPVYEMLGGLCRDKVKTYASLLSYEKPEDAATVALRRVKDGYTAIKIHLRREATAYVASVVKMVREAVGDDIVIMVDVSGAWNPRQAVAKIKELEPYNIMFVEEPVWPMDDYDGLAYVRENSCIPIAAGEGEYSHYGFRNIIPRRAVDVVQPDVTKSGGLLSCRKVLALTEAWNLQLIPHCFCFGPGVAATVHFCLSNMKSEYIEVNAVPLEASFIKPSLRPENGYLSVPDKPGLGIEIDEAVVESHPYISS